MTENNQNTDWKEQCRKAEGDCACCAGIDCQFLALTEDEQNEIFED